MIDWPEQLINDFASQRVVVFIGSGVSRNSVGEDGKTRPKGWFDFLQDAALKKNLMGLVKPYLDRGDYLTTLDLIRNKLTRDQYSALVTNEYLAPKYAEAPIHHHIYRIGSNIVLSPNFDKIYDIYAAHKSRGTVVIKHYYDEGLARFIRGDQRVVIKIHGTVDDPERMIFGRRDYAESRTRYGWFYDMLRALVITHTFVFIGCGTDDPDIRLLFEDVNFSAGQAREHYFVAAQDSIDSSMKIILRDTMNLSVLEYSFDKNIKSHQDLTDSLENLAHIVESSRPVPPVV